MLATNNFMYFIQRLLPGQYWYYIIIGMAVIAAAGGVWAWLRKKNAD